MLVRRWFHSWILGHHVRHQFNQDGMLYYYCSCSKLLGVDPYE